MQAPTAIDPTVIDQSSVNVFDSMLYDYGILVYIKMIKSLNVLNILIKARICN